MKLRKKCLIILRNIYAKTLQYAYLWCCWFRKLISQGNLKHLGLSFTSDIRWRIQRRVVIALQKFGESNIEGLVNEMIN